MKRDPFTTAIEDAYFFRASGRNQHLNMLVHLTQYSELMLLVSGSHGIGKTTLLRQFLNMANDNWRVCLVNANNSLDAESLLHHVAEEFGIRNIGGNAEHKLLRIQEQLIHLRNAGDIPILLVDDAHELNEDTLRYVLRLSDLYDDNGKLLRIILFSEPLVEDILSSSVIRELHQHATHTLEIPPLDENETASYVMHRLGVAGMSEQAHLFNDSRMRRIYKVSHGIPLLINKAARETLLEHLDAGATATKHQRFAIPGTFLNSPRTRAIVPLLLILAVALGATYFVVSNVLYQQQDSSATTEQPEQEVYVLARPDTLVLKRDEQGNIVADKQASATQETTTAKEPAPATSDLGSLYQNHRDKDKADTTEPAAPGTTETSEPEVAEAAPAPPRAEKPAEGVPANPFAHVPTTAPRKPEATAATDTSQDATEAAVTAQKTAPAAASAVAVPETPAPPSEPTAPAVPTKPAAASDYRNWLQQASEQQFTLQLMGASEAARLEKLVQKHKLHEQATVIPTYGSKPWYILVHGRYTSHEQAQAAIDSLPSTLRRARPYVRQIGDIVPRETLRAARSTDIAARVKVAPQPTVPPQTGGATSSQSTTAPPTGGKTPSIWREPWWRQQDPQHFTIMLLGSHDEETVLKFIRDNNLVGKAGYFYTHYEHDSWYVVLYGVYQDKQSALKAAGRLPHYPGTNKPWVRSIASVHADMDQASPLFRPRTDQ